MPIRTGKASWQGTLKEGKGVMALGSGAFEGSYSFGTRFGEEKGTNPDELIGAAHAGCFSMALSLLLEKEGFKPERVQTTAKVHIEKQGEGFTITRIDLDTVGEVKAISPDRFAELADAAKRGCPVSRALAGTEITLQAKLI